MWSSERFPGRRLVCLFQPHTYSRTRYLLDGFRTCFADCDLLLLTDTYAAREEPSAGMDAQQLAGEIREPSARYTGDLERSAAAVAYRTCVSSGAFAGIWKPR